MEPGDSWSLDVGPAGATWACVACGMRNWAQADECPTCRAARPGTTPRPVPEDEAFEPFRFSRVLVVLMAILTVGVLVAHRVRFLESWGERARSQLGIHASRADLLRGGAAALLSYVAQLRGGVIPDAERLARIRGEARIGSGSAGPEALVAADRRLARCVQDLASLRVAAMRGLDPVSLSNELTRVERAIRAAEELLHGTNGT
jgi:hypothetical protein